jgi:Fe-S cluster assembly protein SufD
MTTTTADIASHVEALAAASPGWLADLRREALKRHDELSYPAGREELWRFTDLSLLRPDAYRPLPPEAGPTVATTPHAAAAALELTGMAHAGRAVHADASVVELELSEEARRAGVIYMPMEQAVVEHAELLRPRLGALIGPDDPYRAWSLAAHRGGMFLYVPAGAQIDQPFQALHWASASGAALLPRTVVVVSDGARIVFNDLYISDAVDAPTLASPAVEVFVGRGATVGWVTWQDWGPGLRHHAHVKAHLDRDATLNTLLVTLGADFSRTWKECTLAGEGAQSYMFGLYFPHGEQRFEHWTVQDHVAPHTTSDLLYKGALDGYSQGLYYGTIRVRPGAFRTDAYQANRNLTLSEHARALPNPQLEIENNDVRCTHGATVGRIDSDHLFYLRSRGIPLAEAERLVVFGFFNEVLERVMWSGMHERLAEAIRAKMTIGGTG